MPAAENEVLCRSQDATAPMKISGLEGLRGALALIVLLCHSWLSFIKPLSGVEGTRAQLTVALAAELAVVCFFVLSGHVIALSLRANHARTADFDLSGYALARAFRVLPPLLITIAITWVLAGLLDLGGAGVVAHASAERAVFETIVASQVVSLISFCALGDLSGGLNGPLWSLEWEIRLYVLAGLAACAVWRSLAWRIGALLVLAAYGAALQATYSLAAAIPVGIQFGLGALAAWVHPRTLTRPTLLGCAVTLGAITVGLALRPGSELLAVDLGRGNVSLDMTVAMWFTLALLAARSTPGPRVLVFLGSVSYTLYILHFPLLQAAYFALANHLPTAIQGPAVWWVWPTATVAVLTACVAVGRRIERPAVQRAWAARRLAGWLTRYRHGLPRFD